MNLQSAAEKESPRKTRSKLEAHREAIFALRRKHWTYRQIARWLNEHGVSVTFPSVYRFCEQAITRRPRNSVAPTADEPPAVIPATASFFSQTPSTSSTYNTTQGKKPRFNVPE